MSSPIRVGLVGAGYISEYHVMALRALPGVVLAGICDLDRARAATIAERFGMTGVYASLKEMAAAEHLVQELDKP